MNAQVEDLISQQTEEQNQRDIADLAQKAAYGALALSAVNLVLIMVFLFCMARYSR